MQKHDPKVGILLFEQFHGKMDIGSSRIRGHWIAKYWDEAEIYKMGQQYDVIIYQKVYWIEHAKQFKGIKILDLCDADWFHWGYRVKQMIDLCDAVTTSTEEIAKYIVKITDKPVWCIPDRLDLETFKERKQHVGDAKIVAWYGYSENFPMLDAAVNSLVKNKVEELIVIASRRSPYRPPPTIEGKIIVTNYPWTLETVNQDLLRADIIINPKVSKNRWKYKSNNKTIAAWAIGLPVAHSEEELKSFKTEESRIIESQKRLEEVSEKYNVVKSVEEYKKLIKEIQDEKQHKKTGEGQS